MKYKLKDFIAVSDESMLFNNGKGESFLANEAGIMIIEMVQKDQSKSQIEEFILSEFNIDQDTMQEHLQELLMYMKHNALIDKLPQD